MKSDIPLHDGAEVWIEAGPHADCGAQLRIALAGPLPTGLGDFHVPLAAHDGTALGWMRFRYITTMREKPVFAAIEWRPASEPAPPESACLPLALTPLLAGFAPPL